jgi:hypothetical protein
MLKTNAFGVSVGSIFDVGKSFFQQFEIKAVQGVNVPVLSVTTKSTEEDTKAESTKSPDEVGSLVCRTCNATFPDADKYRQHYKTNWHRFFFFSFSLPHTL